MAYSKSVSCGINGCPHDFDVVVSRFGKDVEEARCPVCYSTTRMVFEDGRLNDVEVV